MSVATTFGCGTNTVRQRNAPLGASDFETTPASWRNSSHALVSPSSNVVATTMDDKMVPGSWNGLMTRMKNGNFANVMQYLLDQAAKDTVTDPKLVEELITAYEKQVTEQLRSLCKACKVKNPEDLLSSIVKANPEHKCKYDLAGLRTIESSQEIESGYKKQRIQEYKEKVSKAQEVVRKLTSMEQELKAKRDEVTQTRVQAMEALLERLRMLQQRREALIRTAEVRTCHVSKPDPSGELLVIFRGGHQLRVRGLMEAPTCRIGTNSQLGSATQQRSEVCLRFEPMLPDSSSSSSSSCGSSTHGATANDSIGTTKLQHQLENILCTAWHNATATEDGKEEFRQQGCFEVVLPQSQLARVVRRLDVQLLQIGEQQPTAHGTQSD